MSMPKRANTQIGGARDLCTTARAGLRVALMALGVADTSSVVGAGVTGVHVRRTYCLPSSVIYLSLVYKIHVSRYYTLVV